MKTIDEYIKYLITNIEGDYVNDPHDKGGETKYGISKRVYPDLDIKNLSVQDAIDIYKRDYYSKYNIDKLPYPFNISVFDHGVNSGQLTAIKFLQECVNTDKDGLIGPNTIRLVSKFDHNLYLADRVAFYVNLSQWPRYGRGWTKRLFQVAEFVYED